MIWEGWLIFSDINVVKIKIKSENTSDKTVRLKDLDIAVQPPAQSVQQLHEMSRKCQY